MMSCLGMVLVVASFHVCNCIKWDVFSTKTIYRWSQNVDRDIVHNGENTVALGNTLFKAIHVNGLFRHGARNPSFKTIDKIDLLHKKLAENKDKSNSKFLFLDIWNSKYDKKQQNLLVYEGVKEHYKMGERLGKRFYQLFNTNGLHIKFISSRKDRARSSSKYFYDGLSNTFPEMGEHVNEINDNTTRFYDGCEKYEKDVEDSVANLQQFQDFHKTPEYKLVSKSIRDRLGLQVPLTSDEVYLIYEMCAYEKYIFNEEPWCSLVTDAEREILEYGQDLEKYYESSYGHPLNSKLACPLVRDMFETMDKAIHDNWDYNNLGNETHTSGYLAGKFQFGHSETVVQLFSTLGLFKDSQALLATNMAAMKNRKFKTSTITPFSSNVVFALYASDPQTENLTKKREYVVKLFVNEDSVIIPGCGADVCRYEDVKKVYKKLMDECNIEDLCSTDDDDDDDDDGNNAVSYRGKILTCMWLFICHMLFTSFA